METNYLTGARDDIRVRCNMSFSKLYSVLSNKYDISKISDIALSVDSAGSYTDGVIAVIEDSRHITDPDDNKYILVTSGVYKELLE